MKLGESSEARVRGYLYVLKRSLPSWLGAATVSDALREVESHIREKVEESDGKPDERAALERILDQLGAPSKVAGAYATEMAVDEAVSSGRLLAVARALGRIAVTTNLYFVTFLGLFLGYGMAFSFFLMALLKPIFPENVGLTRVNGRFRSFGIDFGLPPGATVEGGYWIIPFSIVIGAALLWFTHRWARHVLRTWQSRRQDAALVSGGPTPFPGMR